MAPFSGSRTTSRAVDIVETQRNPAQPNSTQRNATQLPYSPSVPRRYLLLPTSPLVLSGSDFAASAFASASHRRIATTTSTIPTSFSSANKTHERISGWRLPKRYEGTPAPSVPSPSSTSPPSPTPARTPASSPAPSSPTWTRSSSICLAAACFMNFFTDVEWSLNVDDRVSMARCHTSASWLPLPLALWFSKKDSKNCIQ
mmetsp:Transcript_25275/g.53811  ORF Transcript_25275/g.53811 Transcript_25275/m.53811 type:complete len:201 (+) Transcript_25275:1274-1876(+)